MELAKLIEECHARSRANGWWADPISGLSLVPGEVPNTATRGTDQDWLHNHDEELRKRYFPYVVATKIALIHSEISEALEGYRTDAMDDKLVNRKSIEVELADAFIRIGDLAGVLGLDLVGAVDEKFAFNAVRPDHQLKTRAAHGGKKF